MMCIRHWPQPSHWPDLHQRHDRGISMRPGLLWSTVGRPGIQRNVGVVGEEWDILYIYINIYIYYIYYSPNVIFGLGLFKKMWWIPDTRIGSHFNEQMVTKLLKPQHVVIIFFGPRIMWCPRSIAELVHITPITMVYR